MTTVKMKGNLPKMDSGNQKGELSHSTIPCQLEEESSITDPTKLSTGNNFNYRPQQEQISLFYEKLKTPAIQPMRNGTPCTHFSPLEFHSKQPLTTTYLFLHKNHCFSPFCIGLAYGFCHSLLVPNCCSGINPLFLVK